MKVGPDDDGWAREPSYGFQVWKDARALHLSQNPLCVFHWRRGIPVPATVVDHIKRWRGAKTRKVRWIMFLDPNNFQSLCEHCHNSDKQIMERGVKPRIGLDGYPIEDED